VVPASLTQGLAQRDQVLAPDSNLQRASFEIRKMLFAGVRNYDLSDALLASKMFSEWAIDTSCMTLRSVSFRCSSKIRRPPIR
jgi:hypothetical protein